MSALWMKLVLLAPPSKARGCEVTRRAGKRKDSPQACKMLGAEDHIVTKRPMAWALPMVE